MTAWDSIKQVEHFPGAGRHYTVNGIADGGDMMPLLREFVPDELNWIFLATSGIHGSYASLDSAEANLDMFESDTDAYREDSCLDECDPMPAVWSYDITALIVKPRMVTTIYGNAILRSREDIALLRLRVEQTMAGVVKSQDGNRVQNVSATVDDCEGTL
jgi:hypothetical protein